VFVLWAAFPDIQSQCVAHKIASNRQGLGSTFDVLVKLAQSLFAEPICAVYGEPTELELV
jgi:hypothetical protein